MQSRLAYSVEKTRRGAGQRTDFFDDDSRLEHEGPHSPVLADRSGLGHLSLSAAQAQRSVFMENQLDLNESEMEYYEGIINDLADQLETAHAEKEALQDSLERLEQQREAGLQLSQKELNDVRSAFQRMLDDVQTQLAQSNEVGGGFRLRRLLVSFIVRFYRLTGQKLFGAARCSVRSTTVVRSCCSYRRRSSNTGSVSSISRTRWRRSAPLTSSCN